MSDARSKLADALAQAKTKRVSGGPSVPAPKPASHSAKPAKSTPPPASKSQSAPKSTKPAPKKKKAPKPKKSGSGSSGAVFKSFSKFANNMFDELKTATSEISPSALFNTATDSFQSIKKAVGLDNEGPQSDQQERTQSEDTKVPTSTSDENVPPSQNGASASAQTALPRDANDITSPDLPSETTPTQATGPMTSPAKVQRMASKKNKSVSDTKSQEETEPSQEDLLKQLSGDTPISTASTDATSAQDSDVAEPTSPAKVQRAASKKATQPDEDNSDPTQEDLLQQLESDNAEPPQAEENVAPPTDVENVPAQSPEAPATSSATGEPSSETSQKEQSSPSDTKKKPPAKSQAGGISKTEHAVRSFQALHALLNNERWAPLVNSPDLKPSSLYAPREKFDTNFSDPVFRNGLKSASRLASSFGFEPDKMRFNQKLMDQIKNFDLDPGNKIKPHTENISSAIGEEKVKEIMVIYNNKNFKHLLFSISTRMGSFVPTIESLARIYLGLRKKEPLNAGARLQIQEEIMMRYRKAPYTEAMGKKARNLAMNYFMDYLSSYALKLYRERFKDAPEGQDNLESHQRRHATIKTFCCGTIEEWAKKVAISTNAITSIQAKFIEQADQDLEKLTDT